MRIRKACLLLALVTALSSSCGHFRQEPGPLSRADRDRGPLVLDDPDREANPRRRRAEDPGMIARGSEFITGVLPWNWF